MPPPLAMEIARRVSELLKVKGLEPESVAMLVAEPPQEAMGDYSLPCFRLAPKVGKDPKALASELAAGLAADGIVTEVTAAGPYLNITVSTEALAREVLTRIGQAKADGRPYARSEEGAGKTVVIEYSSPNIAKPTGVGLLRTTLIGNALARLYEAGGYEVVRLNYPGDWGTQFGLTLTAWKKWGDEKAFAERGVDYLVELYQRANAEAKEDPAFAGEARAAFKRLEDGDAESYELWRRFREVSLAEFMRLYETLGITFDSFDGEASTRPLIDGAVAEVEKSGLLKTSEGAQVIELGLGDNVPPAMVRKSDGATTYLVRDLAELLNRHRKFRFHKCIYVIGRDQELHMRQLFRVVDLMGRDWAKDCVHVSFGMIRFGGGKMRTRTGKTVGLGDVFDRAFEEVGRIVETRKKGAELTGDEQKKASENVATGAVIFADLSRRRIKDYDFDWDRAFSLDGDSGPYLQYAHARACGILKKAGREVTPDIDFARLSSDPERALLKTLGRYPDAVAAARRENEPAMLASHVVEIGSALNLFYNKCRVLGEERPIEDARLLLVWAAREVMAEGLGTLGIAAPESM